MCGKYGRGGFNKEAWDQEVAGSNARRLPTRLQPANSSRRTTTPARFQFLRDGRPRERGRPSANV